jgi:hypothetical protein
MSGAAAATLALEAIHRGELNVTPIQEYLRFRTAKTAPAPV